MKQRIVFLDRDGVLNRERGEHTYRVEDFEVIEGVPEAVGLLKTAGYRLVVVTNQSGLSQGMYSLTQMEACHQKLHTATAMMIDAVYYSPYHPSVTESLSRKPGSLLFERALARFGVSPEDCWMVGDKTRDLVPARQLGMKTAHVGQEPLQDFAPDFFAANLLAVAHHILWA